LTDEIPTAERNVMDIDGRVEEEGSGRRARALRVAFASVALALGSACATAPVPSTTPGVGCDLNSGAFQQTSPGPCGASKWTFTRSGVDGRYRAKESGCANATGVAAYDGATVVLQFQFGGGAGVYTWPLDGQCRGGPGIVTWTSGPLTGQTIASTLGTASP
jgi:hypothetical protein